MEISACPKCGSRRIFQGRLKEGILTGYTPTTYVCRDCGYQGAPLIFDSEEEYKKFLKELKGKKVKVYEETEYLPDEKRSFITKNIPTKLGLALIVAGILIAAGTLGTYINLTLILILDGVILFFAGLLGEREENQKIEKIKKYPKIAGAIMIVNGMFFLILFVLQIYFVFNIDLVPLAQREQYIGLESFIGIYLINSIFCLIEVIGGVFTVLKKKWEIAIIGAILGTIVFVPLSTIPSLLALIMVSFSKKIFKSNKK